MSDRFRVRGRKLSFEDRFKNLVRSSSPGQYLVVLLTFAYTFAIDAAALLAFDVPTELQSLPRAWARPVAGGILVWLLHENVRLYLGQGDQTSPSGSAGTQSRSCFRWR